METTSTTNGRATPWNKGKLLGQKPPPMLKEIRAIRIRLQLAHRTRELVLFNLAIDCKLRGPQLAPATSYDQVLSRHIIVSLGDRITRRSRSK
jgi:hypothetical protein